MTLLSAVTILFVVTDKSRLDSLLVQRGLVESREKARAAVLAGAVIVEGKPAAKAGVLVSNEAAVELLAGPQYVSRGGEKLAHALEAFHLGLDGLVAVDVGASTGGFTDCLLQQGAARVYAVDVGHGQLAWKLRRDPRVVVMEKTNARFLTPAHFPPPFTPADLVVIDCAFISLTRLLAPALTLLRPGGTMIALVKPQFEAGKAEADHGAGVITDPAIHQRILTELRQFVTGLPGLRWQGVTESPILGPAGNKEFLVLLEKDA